MFPSKTLFTRVQENFWMDEFLTRATRLHETVQILLKKAEPSVYTSPTHHRQVTKHEAFIAQTVQKGARFVYLHDSASVEPYRSKISPISN